MLANESNNEDPEKGLAETLLESLRNNKDQDQPSYVNALTDETTSFQELLVQSVRAAEGWRSLGLAAGDVVIVFSKNRNELFPAVLGCIFNGCTMAIPSPTSTKAELKHALDVCVPKAKAVITEDSNIKLCMELAPECLLLNLGKDESISGVVAYQSLLERGKNVDLEDYRTVPVTDGDDHVSGVLYSSGTTGSPKGVMIRDSSLLKLYREIVVRQRQAVKSPMAHMRQLVTSQLCWYSGFLMMCFNIMNGSTSYFLRDATEQNIITAIEKYKINMISPAPPVLFGLSVALRNQKCDFSSLKFVFAGGSHMSAEVQKQISDAFGVSVVQGYATTETGIISSDTPPNIRFGSVGPIRKWLKYRLVDIDTQQDIETPHKIGELRIKTPCYMKGYIGNPKATAEALDEQGYYMTGDLMYFDEDKYFFFVDRCKEMIKFKNQQIAPAEIEALLLTHPGVRDACVLGKGHPEYGDLPTGFVVRSPGSSVTEQDLDDLISSHLSDYKRLRGGVIFLNSLPRTHSGKTARRELTKLLLDREKTVNIG